MCYVLDLKKKRVTDHSVFIRSNLSQNLSTCENYELYVKEDEIHGYGGQHLKLIRKHLMSWNDVIQCPICICATGNWEQNFLSSYGNSCLSLIFVIEERNINDNISLPEFSYFMLHIEFTGIVAAYKHANTASIKQRIVNLRIVFLALVVSDRMTLERWKGLDMVWLLILLCIIE